MKKFIVEITKFTFPIIFLIGWVFAADFFKVLGFQDYYADQTISLNREMITTSTFNHYREKEAFNSFIFGSSRSQAFKCEKWVDYLDDGAKCFHFDASGEGIWGISKKIEYIDEVGDSIKNALVIVDRSILRTTFPAKGHLFIAMPCVSKLSVYEYYSTFLKASLNPKFLIAITDYALFKTHRKYMGYLIRKKKFNHQVNNRTCDIWYGWDKEIESDSSKYYSKLIEQGVFYARSGKSSAACVVTQKEKDQLLAIKNVFEKHATKYKIVVSPTYDQVPMEQAQIELLKKVFGKENVHDFSGKNHFTQSVHNFYEASHFRPLVANEIMNIVYNL